MSRGVVSTRNILSLTHHPGCYVARERASCGSHMHPTLSETRHFRCRIFRRVNPPVERFFGLRDHGAQWAQKGGHGSCFRSRRFTAGFRITRYQLDHLGCCCRSWVVQVGVTPWPFAWITNAILQITRPPRPNHCDEILRHLCKCTFDIIDFRIGLYRNRIQGLLLESLGLVHPTLCTDYYRSPFGSLVSGHEP